MVEGSFAELRLAARALRRDRAFTALVVLAIAIATGATLAVTGVVHSVALRPLPWPDSDRIVALREVMPSGPERGRRGGFLLDNLREWRRGARTISHLAAYNGAAYTATGQDQPERLEALQATPELFAVLGVAPSAGRVFTQEEADRGETALVVLSQRARRRFFPGVSEVVGRALELDGTPYTVLGVMPEGFAFPDRAPQIWTPLDWQPTSNPHEERHIMLPAIGRLAPGATVEQAESEGQLLLERLRNERQNARAARAPQAPPIPETELQVESLLDQQTGALRPAFRLLLAAVAVVLLVACANVANLLLVRGTKRRRELATRAALGLDRRRLLRLLVLESLLLSVAGSALGLAIAAGALRLLRRVLPAGTPRIDEIGLHAPMLLLALGLLAGCTVLFGVVPLLQVRFDALARGLGRGEASRHGRASQGALRSGIAVAEMALALVLLLAAGLLLTSFLRLMRTDLGYRADGLLTAQVAPPPSRYAGPARLQFLAHYLERVRQQQGVDAAGIVNVLPLFPGRMVVAMEIEGRGPAADPREEPQADLRVMTDGALEAMGVPVLEGRSFDARDRGRDQPIVLVSESFAKLHLAERTIGARLQPFGEVVGVVGDVRAQGFDRDPLPTIYVPFDAAPPLLANIFPRLALVVRADRPLRVVPALQAALRALDTDLVLEDIRSMDDRLADSVAQPRLLTGILVVFAALSLVLAAIGVYGVLSFAVSQETRDNGVRLALGADPRRLLRRTLRRGAVLALVGIALGILASTGLSRFLAALLHDTKPTDAATYSWVCAVLLLSALLACWLPARRAAAADPVELLRRE